MNFAQNRPDLVERCNHKLTVDTILSTPELLRKHTLEMGLDDTDLPCQSLDDEDFCWDLQNEYASTYDRVEEDVYTTYQVIYNYVHPLPSDVAEVDIIKLAKECSDVVVIADDYDNYYLALTCCGMDLSERIAYAYMVCANHIPPNLIPRRQGLLTYGQWAEMQEFLNKPKDLFIVFVDDLEVAEHYMPIDEAKKLARKYQAEGYAVSIMLAP